MTPQRVLFFTLQILLFFSLKAQAVEVVTWSAIEGLPPLILAVRDGESADQAAHRYRKTLLVHPGIKSVFSKGLPEFKFGTYGKLPNGEQNQRQLLIANSEDDYRVIEGKRVLSFSRVYDEVFGRRSYVLPIGHDLGLTRAEGREFRRLVNPEFPMVIPMGGADFAPATYDDENRDARDFNLARDRSEIRFLKSYINDGTGLIFGVCRGAQGLAIALGYKLVQDVPKRFGSLVNHAAGAKHRIDHIDTPGSWIKEATAEDKEVMIGSWHHQAVDLSSNPNGPLIETARSPDGVLEAAQSRDGRVFLMQFHPELMNEKNGMLREGRQIMRAMVEKVRRLQNSRQCLKVFTPAA